MCVNTIVLSSPIFRATNGAMSCENADNRPGPEEEQSGLRQRETESLEEPERHQRIHDEPARERIDAEERRELEDDPARRAERRGFPRGGAVAARGRRRYRTQMSAPMSA